MTTSSARFSATLGMLGILQAPVAKTTVRLCQSPRSVDTRKPPSFSRSEVTLVLVSTGAEITLAYRSMNPMVSAMLRKPSGSFPS